ncbi:MAG: hypothetical protein D6705_04210 [Deltaproteobacteria bacterium]|nr:MAG: hypothetical protein D6705_04210 [Deltaproteobacteria bacterium]
MDRHLLRFQLLCGVAWGVACQQLPEPALPSGDTGTGGATAGSTTFDDTPPSADCDPGDQDCPDGQKCTAIAQGATRNHYTCVADGGDLPEGEPCTKSADGIDGCAAGTLCVEDRLDQGRCLGACLNDGDCSGGRCRQAPFDDVDYCAAACDPLVDTCPPNMACTPIQDGFVCTFPYEDDTGVAGSSCDPFANRGCMPGLTCLQGTLIPGCGDAGCCTVFCNTTDPQAASECQSVFGTPGVTCVEFFSGPAPGYEHVGVCMVPA